MGLPVTARMESAAPPRVSPSSLVSTTPVMPSRSSKVLATLTASWPVIASTTSRISCGATSCLMFSSSCIRLSSICRRPAVSTIITSRSERMASRFAARTIPTGSSWPISKTGTSTCEPTTCSCLMAAGR